MKKIAQTFRTECWNILSLYTLDVMKCYALVYFKAHFHWLDSHKHFIHTINDEWIFSMSLLPSAVIDHLKRKQQNLTTTTTTNKNHRNWSCLKKGINLNDTTAALLSFIFSLRWGLNYEILNYSDTMVYIFSTD